MRVLAWTARHSLATSLVLFSSIAQPAASSAILVEVRAAVSDELDDATREQLRLALRQRGALTEPRAIAELRNEILPLAGRWDLAVTLIELTSQLDTGVRSYLRGNFDLAVAQLEDALALVRRNPALTVSDVSAPQWMTRALASLALAKLRLRDHEGAFATMAEQIQSYPDVPVTRDAFGGRGEALYREVRRALEDGPRGSLLIDVSAPDARIYLNEVRRGRGGEFAAEVFPGRYRLLVMVGERGRLYRLTVHADEQTRLTVDWSADASFASSPRWIGFRVPTAATRDALLPSFARRLVFHDVLALGPLVHRDAGRPDELWGAFYERGTGRELRRGALPLTTADVAALRRFAGFLMTGSDADEFARAPAATSPTDARLPGPPGSGPAPASAEVSDWPSWAFLGFGLASLGTGSYLAIAARRARCADDVRDCGPVAHAQTWAIALLSGGVASLGIAAFFLLEDRRPPPPHQAAIRLIPMRRGGVATLDWRF